MTLLKNVLTLILPILVLALTACQGDGDAAPVGSSIVINPSEIDLTVTVPADNPATPDVDESNVACSFTDETIIVNVNDPSGAPLGKTDLLIHLDLAGNTLPPGSIEPMRLFEDTNNNLIIDGEDENVTQAGDPGYVTSTDDAGVKVLFLRMMNACVGYRGQLTVFASGGRLTNLVDIEIKKEVASAGG